MRVYLLLCLLFFCGVSNAQKKNTGSVTNSKDQPITNITTKAEGKVTELDEIVVSASRTPERILESPVTIERMGEREMKNTTAATFYDGLENLKDVQFNSSSLSFKSVNTRGFAAVGNTRFTQLVDGMDNSSPALNFVLGNLLGMSEIDVKSAEILPGAASALYGANAFNGIMLMTSKNPFDYHGITAYAKFGQTNQQAAGTNSYTDIGVRLAGKASEKFAAKANITFMKATDWYATDDSDWKNSGRTRSHQNYDGLNIYGDEVSTNLKSVGKSLAGLGLITAETVNLLPNENVSRTGYKETDLTDNKIENVKADASFHYRPFGTNKLEIIFQNKVGFGNTTYQAASRYMLKDFFMMQNKLEVVGKNFFARAYITSENAGNSYDMVFTGWNVNKAWKSDATWFGEYAGAFARATLDPSIIGGAFSEQAKHNFARMVADNGRYTPGSPEFKAAFDQVIKDANFNSGSKFQDKSRIYHSDANYNFKELISFAEIQVGTSVRQYEMNSMGSIFTDENGPIRYNEFGAYSQVIKKIADEKLKFTGSVRYDKSQNFSGNFSPRISFVYSAGEQKNHNFRVSYQTGFRNPTTQDQYIGLDLGAFALIGSANDNLSRFSETRSVSQTAQDNLGIASSVILNGHDAYTNSYSLSSVSAYVSTINPTTGLGDLSVLKVSKSKLVAPERVKSYEIGYRSSIQKITIDVNAYYNVYNNFIANERVITPYYGKVGTDFTNPENVKAALALASGDRRVYQLYTNSTTEINSLGVGLGLTSKIFGNYEIGANYNFSEFHFDQNANPDFIAGFNTPKHRVKASFGNPKLIKNLGFNFNTRWNSAYVWQSTFADGVIAKNTVFDMQLSYGLTKLKSTVKLGATNLFGKNYIQVVGSGAIGQQWFLSWTILP